MRKNCSRYFYKLFKGNELVYIGLASDIVNDYYVSLSTVYSAYRSKTKLLGEYRIERCVIKR